MENQLHLRIATDSTPAPDWQLDESVRAVGRSGIALARAALEQARRTRSIDHPAEDRDGHLSDTDPASPDHTTAA